MASTGTWMADERGTWNSVPELKNQANSDEILGEVLGYLFPARDISMQEN
jgi:hypothetical protein